ncbi:PREDICTED: uncharacterized protein LOC106740972 isoform X1 [Dinoponera quadriceps]|uniref:NADH dehydrogenase [ubiquinone] 1 beta subcomplex subunit 4 n=1 Tax=Dinoponera quadriceps TaxID=609295 RepID=A0A6P3WQ40_DINQU|nr:PREDICTED: uncharacterized protein LOC106740972 isoform X1 [Dinoponera quadriceps]
MSNKDTYNLSPEQQEISRWRDAKRQQLREMYLRDSGHPTKSLLCDTGIYRFASANATVAKRFVPTAKNFLIKSTIIGSSIFFTWYIFTKERSAREHLYSTGQISYADRENKLLN